MTQPRTDMLVLALRGQGWAAYASVVLGALGCYALTMELSLGRDLRPSWFMLLVSGMRIASGVAAVVLHAGSAFMANDKA